MQNINTIQNIKMGVRFALRRFLKNETNVYLFEGGVSLHLSTCSYDDIFAWSITLYYGKDSICTYWFENYMSDYFDLLTRGHRILNKLENDIAKGVYMNLPEVYH